MLVSKKPLIYVRKDERQGISQKTNNPYHMRQVILSDGIESFTLDFSENCIFSPNLMRGDSVNVEVIIQQQGTRTQTIVTTVQQAKA